MICAAPVSRSTETRTTRRRRSLGLVSSSDSIAAFTRRCVHRERLKPAAWAARSTRRRSAGDRRTGNWGKSLGTMLSFLVLVDDCRTKASQHEGLEGVHGLGLPQERQQLAPPPPSRGGRSTRTTAVPPTRTDRSSRPGGPNWAAAPAAWGRGDVGHGGIRTCAPWVGCRGCRGGAHGVPPAARRGGMVQISADSAARLIRHRSCAVEAGGGGGLGAGAAFASFAARRSVAARSRSV